MVQSFLAEVLNYSTVTYYTKGAEYKTNKATF